MCVRTNANNCWHYSICSAVSEYTTRFWTKKKAHSPFDSHMHTTRSHTQTESAGMFALRHTQQLSSLAQTHLHIGNVLSFTLSYCVTLSNWTTEPPCHCVCAHVWVCARYFHIKIISHNFSSTFFHATNWYSKRIPCDRQPSSQKWWWRWTTIELSLLCAHTECRLCRSNRAFPLRNTQRQMDRQP